MKKVFLFAAIAMAAASFSSCSNKKSNIFKPNTSSADLSSTHLSIDNPTEIVSTTSLVPTVKPSTIRQTTNETNKNITYDGIPQYLKKADYKSEAFTKYNSPSCKIDIYNTREEFEKNYLVPYVKNYESPDVDFNNNLYKSYDKYNKTFFGKYSLCFVNSSEGSGSIQQEIDSVLYTGIGKVMIILNRLSPHLQSCDEKTWQHPIELKKSFGNNGFIAENIEIVYNTFGLYSENIIFDRDFVPSKYKFENEFIVAKINSQNELKEFVDNLKLKKLKMHLTSSVYEYYPHIYTLHYYEKENAEYSKNYFNNTTLYVIIPQDKNKNNYSLELIGIKNNNLQIKIIPKNKNDESDYYYTFTVYKKTAEHINDVVFQQKS